MCHSTVERILRKSYTSTSTERFVNTFRCTQVLEGMRICASKASPRARGCRRGVRSKQGPEATAEETRKLKRLKTQLPCLFSWGSVEHRGKQGPEATASLSYQYPQRRISLLALLVQQATTTDAAPPPTYQRTPSDAAVAEAASRLVNAASATRFTCFPSTTGQILTQKLDRLITSTPSVAGLAEAASRLVNAASASSSSEKESCGARK
jgi:hypothetical protein